MFKNSFICLFFLASSFVLFDGFSAHLWAAVSLGAGSTNAFYIDKDGDGYGVAAPLGPDCDDSDDSKHVPSDHTDALNYIPNYSGNIYYIATDGNDGTGSANEVSKPYATYLGLPAISAGDTIVFRGGIYNSTGAIFAINDFTGTAGEPVTVMGYPGELVTFIRQVGGVPSNEPIGANRSSYVNFKWFKCKGSTIGMNFTETPHFTITECEFDTNSSWGIKAMQNLIDFKIESCVAHDTIIEHGFYLGARDKPNSNITFIDNISYRNGRHGFQHNGRVDNMKILRNIIHSNELGGISIINGMTNSHISRNLIFNNNKQGIIFYIYDYTSTGQIPYNITNNLVDYNTIWCGKYNNGLGNDNPMDVPGAILFTDNTGLFTMIGNALQYNILVINTFPPIWFSQLKHVSGTKIHNNVFYKLDGDIYIMGSYEGDGTETYMSGRPFYYWDLSSFENLSILIDGNIFSNPKFVNVDIDYVSDPGLFDFSQAADSPSIGLGSEGGMDLRFNTVNGESDAGVYEYMGQPIAPPLLRLSIH